MAKSCIKVVWAVNILNTKNILYTSFVPDRINIRFSISLFLSLYFIFSAAD